MTREEAIKIIKEFVNGTCLHLVDQEALETLIPELKESDDERIRKEIIEYLKIVDKGEGDYAHSMVSSWIDWLKRQGNLMKALQTSNAQIGELVEENYKLKEQKPKIYIPKFRDGDKIKLKGSNLDLTITNIEGSRYYGKGWSLDIVSADESYELVEQKSVEINEYEIIKKHITEDFLSSEVNKRLKECGWYVTDEKPAEWNLSQLKMFDDILVAIELDKAFTPKRVKELVNLINTCRLHKYSTEPTDWSEEDEENIQTRFAFYTYKDDPCTLYLSNVFVEEASRNKGFGTKILTAAEKVAETFGVTYIRLKVKQGSPANAWYRKNGYSYVAFENGYDWLEKNLEYVKPNKQEWSKEDEEHKQWILECLADGKRKIPEFAKQYQEAFNWLKFLYPSWKPSEQEKSALRTAICVLTEERNFPKTAEQLQAILDAFDDKEARKEWKPSEEQIRTLDIVISDYRHACIKDSDKKAEILKQLLEQIKKI